MKEERAIKRKKRKIKFFIKLGIFLLLCGLIVFLLKSPLFDVKEFTVEGNSYYTDDEILGFDKGKDPLKEPEAEE